MPPARRKSAANPYDYGDHAAPTPISAEQANNALATLRSVGDQLAASQAKVEATKEAHEEAKRDHNALARTKLPDLMNEVQVDEFKLADGRKVELTIQVEAKIPEDKEVAAFAWLRQQGEEAIIKRVISVSFPKGADRKAEQAKKALEKLGLQVDDGLGVHHSTLKATLKRLYEQGVQVPLETFGAWIGQAAVLRAPKRKKNQGGEAETPF